MDKNETLAAALLPLLRSRSRLLLLLPLRSCIAQENGLAFAGQEHLCDPLSAGAGFCRGGSGDSFLSRNGRSHVRKRLNPLSWVAEHNVLQRHSPGFWRSQQRTRGDSCHCRTMTRSLTNPLSE